MMRLLAGVAAAPGPAGSTEVALAPRTSEAVPFTLVVLDVSVVLLDAATRTGARRCVEGRTVLRLIVVGLGAERPTVPRRSVPQPPAPLTMAATTVATDATATPTAIGSAQINIRTDARENRFGAAARQDYRPPHFVSVALAKQASRSAVAAKLSLRSNLDFFHEPMALAVDAAFNIT
jgi:hypothetical protein